jgi:hypothetical protein
MFVSVYEFSFFRKIARYAAHDVGGGASIRCTAFAYRFLSHAGPHSLEPHVVHTYAGHVRRPP